MQYPRKYQVKKSDEVSGSKGGKRKFDDVWKSSFRGSLMIPITTLWLMHCYVCRKAGPDIADNTEFATVKKFKCESLVFLNKSLKHEKCFNVVSEKTHSATKYLLPHSGINNYVQINTYWRYIVQIMASNILLLASKNCFPY